MKSLGQSRGLEKNFKMQKFGEPATPLAIHRGYGWLLYLYEIKNLNRGSLIMEEMTKWVVLIWNI